MANLAATIQNIKSEFRIDEEGKASVSIRGAARLADVDNESIRKALSSADHSPSQLAQFLMGSGFEGADLKSWAELGIPDKALALILEYYAYETQPRYRSEQAKQCCRAFRSIGIRSWIQEETGWQSKPQQPQTQLEILQGAINLLVEQDRRMRQLEDQVAEFERIRREAEESIKQLPAPTVEANPLSTRIQLNRLIRDFVQKTGCSYGEIWQLVYREFRDRYHIDLQTRAKNINGKALDVCEKLGLINELYSTASAILMR